MRDIVLKFVLKNQYDFGSVNQKVVLGLILREFPDLKKDVPKVLDCIQKVTGEMNKLSKEEVAEQLKAIDETLLHKEKKQKRKKGELPELANAEMGKVITRIPPEPSKYLHLGHAASFLINYLYAQKYQGKCVLRLEDTNPEKATQEFVDAIIADIRNYLDITPAETLFVSDHMDQYYAFADSLVKKQQVYTCHCPSEKISTYRREMKQCSCRNKSWEGVSTEWQQLKEGTIVGVTLRLKIDMEHKNAVMRDPVIFRLCTAPHYRQGEKYAVWPMYDFENAIEEGLQGITHVLRSDEFASRIELQNYIRDLFNLPNPTVRQYARFNIAGATTKGREIRALIASGDYIGWDDPRLVTLQALRRRGIVKEAFYELAKVVGLSKTPSTIDFSVIASINRKLLDEQANRYYAIFDPMLVEIKNFPKQQITLDLHPHKQKGGRELEVTGKVYLSANDISQIKDQEIVRLIHCCNIKKEGNTFVYVSEDTLKGNKKIHWVPSETAEAISILWDDGSWHKGVAEKTISKLQEGAVVQFERTCFARLDNKTNKQFWYTHS